MIDADDFGGRDLAATSSSSATPTPSNGATATKASESSASSATPEDGRPLVIGPTDDPADFAPSSWWDEGEMPATKAERQELMRREIDAQRAIASTFPGLLESGIHRRFGSQYGSKQRGELSRFVRDWTPEQVLSLYLAWRAEADRRCGGSKLANTHEELARAAEEAELDAFAARDREARPDDGDSQSQPSERELFHRAPALVEPILRNARLPWIELGLDDHGPSIVRVRLGAYVVLVGSEGSGKSSLVLQLGSTFARNGGVFVYLSVELDEEEAAGRLIAQYSGASWEDALRGRVDPSVMREALDLPRFVILAGDDATIPQLERVVARLRVEFPGRPIVVGADYIQAMDGPGREERARVASVSKALRRSAKRLGLVVIGVSQTSRANRKPLRDGDAVGSDTVTAGAETSQLERDAYVTLALGGIRVDADGTTSMDVSIGKMRMGQGDRVVPVIYDGRSGRFAIAGEARHGSEVRAEREASRNEGRVRAAELAIPGALAAAAAPMTRDEVARDLRARKADVSAAVRALLAREEIVQVRLAAEPGSRRGRNGALRLWTREHALAAGLDIVPAGFGGSDA